MCPCGCIGKRKRGSYLAKTVQGGSKLLYQVMFGEDVATARGLLQRIDPPVKLLSLMGLLIVAGLTHSMIILGVMYAATLVLASVSALPVSFFITMTPPPAISGAGCQRCATLPD